jgi:hypothetical protein
VGAVLASMRMRLDQATRVIPLGLAMGLLLIGLNVIHSAWIAVQNFNEQACILGLGAFYAGMTRFGLSAFTAITVFGVIVAAMMWLIRGWYASNVVRYPDEVAHLLSIARLDKH